jgi:hypothetical protein
MDYTDSRDIKEQNQISTKPRSPTHSPCRRRDGPGWDRNVAHARLASGGARSVVSD